MKFYIDKYENNIYFWNKIKNNKLTAIYLDYNIWFYKDGKMHNNKNAAYIENSEYKEFSLNGKYCGKNTNFTKKSWRRFVKLQIFL
jgi:major membrane immunogen (membrane-anchored lipoprotein)